VRTAINFHVLLGKVPHESHNPLKADIGTHAPSHETVHLGVNAITTRWKDTADDPDSDKPITTAHMDCIHTALENTHHFVYGNCNRSGNLTSKRVSNPYQTPTEAECLCKIDSTC
jgi:hypothetical protein